LYIAKITLLAPAGAVTDEAQSNADEILGKRRRSFFLDDCRAEKFIYVSLATGSPIVRQGARQAQTLARVVIDRKLERLGDVRQLGQKLEATIRRVGR
jgi:hypothetical protein